LGATPAPAVDPTVTRVATLEALRDLRQIPALQSLAQGLQQAMNRPDVAVDEVAEAIKKDGALCVRACSAWRTRC